MLKWMVHQRSNHLESHYIITKALKKYKTKYGFDRNQVSMNQRDTDRCIMHGRHKSKGFIELMRRDIMWIADRWHMS